jgi:hypothetical protein
MVGSHSFGCRNANDYRQAAVINFIQRVNHSLDMHRIPSECSRYAVTRTESSHKDCSCSGKKGKAILVTGRGGP